MFEIMSLSAKSARWWFKNRGDIDMDPEYQRAGGIWNDEDQKFLIDSILNDYDIPKFYVADFTTGVSLLNTERKKFAVIDGKQRFGSIFRFLSDDLSLAKDFSYVRDPGIKLCGLRFSDIEARYPSIASKIEEFPLSVMHVVTDERERINELFVRLNKGLKLSGAEVRNAMIGPIPKAIRRLAEDDFFKRYVTYPDRRGQSLNMVAKFLLLEMYEGAIDLKKSQLDWMVEDNFDATYRDIEPYVERVEENILVMKGVFHERDELLRTQGNIPIYFLWIPTVKKANRVYIRPFLHALEEELKRARNMEASKRMADLASYILAARNANDSGSVQTRLKLINGLFLSYLESGKISPVRK